MEPKASLGNPFTTQPIYIAACAFLKETVEQTATSNAQSRDSSPTRNKEKGSAESRPGSAVNGTPTQSKRISISGLSNQSNTANATTTPNEQRRSSLTVEQHKSSDKTESSALSAAK